MNDVAGLLFLLALLSPSASAGVKIVRTGGDVLMCSQWVETLSADGKSIQITPAPAVYKSLDVEANRRKPFYLSPRTSDLSGDEWNRARQLIERLRWLDPKRTDKYLTWLKDFPKQVEMEDRTFDDVDDSAHFVEDLDCQRLQAVIQENDGTHVRYKLSTPVWSQLDQNIRSFTIVHELIYRDAFTKGHENSFFVSHLTALLASDAVGTMSRYRYAAILSELGL